MNKRVSVGQAMELSSEKLAFIRGNENPQSKPGEPKQKVNLATPIPTSIDTPDEHTVSEETVSQAQTNSPRRGRLPKQAKSQSKATKEQPSAIDSFLVLRSFRIRYSTYQALTQAHLERRMRHQTPYRLQEIVQEALDQWLETHHFHE